MMQMIVKLKKQTGAKRDFRSRPTNILRISYLKVFAKSHILKFFLLQNLISKTNLKDLSFLKFKFSYLQEAKISYSKVVVQTRLRGGIIREESDQFA